MELGIAYGSALKGKSNKIQSLIFMEIKKQQHNMGYFVD